MGRYLLYLSYLGTKYSGLQIQNVGNVQRNDFKTVVGLIKKYLCYLRPRDEVHVVTSSRTDQGVHALSNTVHVDIVKRYGQEFEASEIEEYLNRFLFRAKEDVRVVNTIRVNDDFHCRHKATGRSYMYRLAVSKSHIGSNSFLTFPIVEYHRCHTIIKPFDTDKFFKSAEIFSGIHDFKAFTVESRRREITNPHRNMTVGIKKGQIIFNEEHLLSKDMYTVWEIHFTSGSYMYKQIRRMVFCMINVALGIIQLEDLKKLLQNSAYLKCFGDKHIMAAPSHGLYLKQVHYNPTDLVYLPNRDVEFECFQDEAYDNYFCNLYNENTSTETTQMKLVNAENNLEDLEFLNGSMPTDNKTLSINRNDLTHPPDETMETSKIQSII